MAERRPAGYPKLKNYKPSRFMLPTSHYDKAKVDRAVKFIENLCHTKGKWAGKQFCLLPWQEQLIRNIFGIVKPDRYRQFRTAFVEICKKVGNWDNELSVTSSHKLVVDIQNRTQKNMIAYQKKVIYTVSSKQLIVVQSKVNSTFSGLEKKFMYYRLSLYTFSLASFMEIMLSGNFKEEYIAKVKDEIQALSDTYRAQFEKSSLYLEKLGNAGVEANVVKDIGTAGKAIGKLIGNIPLVKEGSADEFLKDKGNYLQENAMGMEREAVKEFAAVANPGTRVFVEKMEDMIQIYNHTSQICFDSEKIYLLA